MSFDTSTSFTTVTSDMCSNCESQAYHQQEESSNNRGLDFELEFDQNGEKITLDVMTFTDTVCLNDDPDDSMCMGQF